MSSNAHFDVDDVHSLIAEVNSYHQPTEQPVEPGWLNPRGGGDDADAHTDTSMDTCKDHQDEYTYSNDEYTYSSEAANRSSGGYHMGEAEDDDDEHNDEDDGDEANSQTSTGWPGSHYSSNADTTASDYTRYTAPSYVGTAQQQQQLDDLDEQEEARGPLLVCEFRDLCNCPEIFNSDEADAWITHICERHLAYSFPAKSVCWFCNDGVFDVNFPSHRDRKGKRSKKTGGEGGDSKQAKRAQAFQMRLEHVAWHIVEERRYRYQNMRPDFSLMKHMHKHGLLDDDMFHYATAYTERPAILKPKKQKPIKTNPPDWEQPHKVLERERRSQIIYDQPKEDRQRKREKESKRREE